MAQDSKDAKKNSSATVATVIGGLAAAAAVGGYFLYHNKEAQQKMKAVKGWALKAKGEVLEKIEKLKEVNEGVYNTVVDAVVAKYEKLSHIDAADIAKFSKELKSHWKSMQSEISDGGSKVAAVVKVAAKSASKAVKKEISLPGTPAKRASGMKKA